LTRILRPDTVHTSYVEDGDGAHIVRGQLIGPILDVCAELRNSGMHGAKDMRHVASVPNAVIEYYCNVAGISLREFFCNPEHAKRFLNDPDNSGFRVAPGRI